MKKITRKDLGKLKKRKDAGFTFIETDRKSVV